MSKRTAATLAGALVLMLAAATSAMAVNLGILDANAKDNVGELDITPTSAPAAASTTTAPARTTTSTSAPPANAATTTSVAPRVDERDDRKAPGTSATTRPAVRGDDTRVAPVDDHRGRDGGRNSTRRGTSRGTDGRGDDD